MHFREYSVRDSPSASFKAETDTPPYPLFLRLVTAFAKFGTLLS